MSNSKELINTLATERKRLEISTYRLGIKTNMAHTTISRIEKGETNPSLQVFLSIAEELGYDITLTKREENTSPQTSKYTKIAAIMNVANELGYNVIPGKSLTEEKTPEIITLIKK